MAETSLLKRSPDSFNVEESCLSTCRSLSPAIVRDVRGATNRLSKDVLRLVLSILSPPASSDAVAISSRAPDFSWRPD